MRRELPRFLLVGGLAVAIDGLSYVGLTQAGLLDPAWAKRLSFAIGALWAYGANKFYTFEQRRLSRSEPLLFALVYLVGWVLNSLVHDLSLRLYDSRTLAFFAATGVSTCSNFAGQKWLVFRPRSAA